MSTTNLKNFTMKNTIPSAGKGTAQKGLNRATRQRRSNVFVAISSVSLFSTDFSTRNKYLNDETFFFPLEFKQMSDKRNSGFILYLVT